MGVRHSSAMSTTDLAPTPEAETEQRRSVLVVEADVRLRTAVAAYLRECGYTVVQAGDSDEAMAFLDGGITIDVVFADVAVTGAQDGFALARWVRENLPGTKVILTSGPARTARDAARLCDERDVLAKPYAHEELARRIRMLLAD